MWLLQLAVGYELFSRWSASCSLALCAVLRVRRQPVERQPTSSATCRRFWR